MTKLDRKLQLEILEHLAKVYPGIAQISPSEGETSEDIAANLYYLAQHGLVDVPANLVMSGERRLGTPGITAKGMDFLQGDGGLSAILGVVTVKLHEDTIRQLVIEKIEKAEGDQTTKAALIEKVKKLPAEALGKLAMDGLSAAISNAPKALDLIGNFLG